MPRLARLDIPNYWYHIVCRGQRRENIFQDEEDYNKYLELLGKIFFKNDTFLGAYCLIPNHIHLLIYRYLQSLGMIFRQLNMTYASYFNKKHLKNGYVFQGRFFSKIVLKETYLANLLYYMHYSNPVDSGLAKSAEHYHWSSDNFYRRKIERTDIPLIRAPGFEGQHGINRYMELITRKDVVETPQGKQYIGTDDEFEQLDRRKPGRSWLRIERRAKLPIEQRVHEYLNKVNLELTIVQSPLQTKNIARVRTKLMAQLYAEGYPASSIARYLKRSYNAVISSYQRNKNEQL